MILDNPLNMPWYIREYTLGYGGIDVLFDDLEEGFQAEFHRRRRRGENEELAFRKARQKTNWQIMDMARGAGFRHNNFDDATNAFENLDERRTGSIPCTRESIMEAVRLAGLNPTEREMDQLMKISDFGEKITKTEFLSLMSKIDWQMPEDMKTGLEMDFAMFVNGTSQIISEEEMMNILTSEGKERMCVDEAKLIVDKFDRDAQGDIVINDLIDQLLAVTPQS